MARLQIHDIRPGMTLESDVKDRNGRMLLKAGVALNEGHLRIFKIWGVTEADVLGVSRQAVDEEAQADIAPELLEVARLHAESRFRHNDQEHPAVRELMKLCIARKAQEAMRRDMAPEDLLRQVQKPQLDEPDHAPLPPVDINGLIHESLKLGTLPVIFHKLVEVVNDSLSSAADVAEIISNDTDLSARLLRVVNSPFYGLGSQVDTITRAVAILGSNQLVSLAMGMTVVTFFKGIPSELINMQEFWRHSISCGIAARILSSYHKTPNTERFFVVGLLHDIGRLIIYKELPDHARRILHLSRSRDMLLTEAEHEVLGFDHATLGGLLMRKWKLPMSLEMNVRYHHAPDQAQNVLEASIICMSNVLATVMELGSSGERYVPQLWPAVWEMLNIPLGTLVQTAIQLDFQVDEVLKFFTHDER